MAQLLASDFFTSTRLCAFCKEDRDISWFIRDRNGKLRGRCKKCRREYEAAWRERNREKIRARARARKFTDPEGYARTRAKNKEACKKWREANKEYIAAYNKKRWEEIKADPILHAIYCENTRINHVLKQEKRGHIVTKHAKNVIKLPERDSLILASHFIPFIHGNLKELSRKSGVDEALLRRIKSGDKRYLYLSTADKLATALNLPLAAYMP